MITNLAEFKGKHVFIIVRNENDLPAVEEAIVIEFRCDHYGCDLINPRLQIQKTKYRLPSQIFLTEIEAQKEMDDLALYIEYRMSSHKMK